MLYFRFNAANELTAVADSDDELRKATRDQWIGRHNFKSYEQAKEIAAQATALTGELHIASDCGEWVSPRYDVVVAPKMGDAVSYSFNGDYYPDGEIIHITPGTLRIIKTSNGGTYYKRGDRAAWTKKGGTWSLIPGHHDRRNPEF